ncbi:TrkH family potassium uptake protein [Anoxynatronum buryatiense]|uniref:Trk system potassium uptake protein TrkH n=1 Tax=Anoxynatronum buryatiense TaxID=489973 RepID=A0AA45WTF9_9CLOT|nr:TrkH family potassium uptake protein [Anoxynatronum buryatiense]SMP40737.1 trk system potassium uptake protein TrkH [Anoxynatronum buryatiense]
MNSNELKSRLYLNPARILVMGFAAVILVGMSLLMLPAASIDQTSVGFVDALFTATSAVCVTGLVVVDTGTHWTVFGKTVIAFLIQIGGIGFMSMATLFAVILGKRISLKERLLIQQAVGQNTLSGVVRFSLYLLALTFGLELVGALLLSFRFVPEYGLATGVGYAVFHAVSAFCNAGFDLIGDGRSLTPYVSDPLVNFTVGGLVILGGLGFTVVLDIINHYKTRRYALHTRLVLMMTVILLAGGTCLFLLLEWNNPETMGNLHFLEKVQAGFFQSLTTRTAGFNTVDTASLTTASQLLTVILMFIGGSPASTAGGIKTVTFGVMLIMAVSVIQGKENVEIFRRKIPFDIVNRAVTILVIGLLMVVMVTMGLSIMEPHFSFMEILFEVTSAFGTVGLSTGITSMLSTPGKVLLIITMFAGRVGTLTIAFALASRQSRYQNLVHYAEERVMVG